MYLCIVCAFSERTYNTLLFLQRFSKFCVWKYNRKVCEDDQREFLNGWYILVIISDVMAIIGSILKMEIQAKVIMKLGCRLTSFSITVEEKIDMLTFGN